jgi:hypothetical protein
VARSQQRQHKKLQRIQSETERPLNYSTTKEGRKVIEAATIDQLVKCFAEETQGLLPTFSTFKREGDFLKFISHL